MKERSRSPFEEVTSSYMNIDAIRDEIDQHDKINEYIDLKMKDESSIDLKDEAIDEEFEGL